MPKTRLGERSKSHHIRYQEPQWLIVSTVNGRILRAAQTECAIPDVQGSCPFNSEILRPSWLLGFVDLTRPMETPMPLSLGNSLCHTYRVVFRREVYGCKDSWIYSI